MATLRRKLAENGRIELSSLTRQTYDDELQQAVSTFQRRNDLTVDGVAGLQTFLALRTDEENKTTPRLKPKSGR